MSRDDANRVLMVLLESIPEDGCPESYVELASQEAGFRPGYTAVPVALAVAGGLLENDGHYLRRGPKFSAVHAAYVAWRESR